MSQSVQRRGEFEMATEAGDLIGEIRDERRKQGGNKQEIRTNQTALLRYIENQYTEHSVFAGAMINAETECNCIENKCSHVWVFETFTCMR